MTDIGDTLPKVTVKDSAGVNVALGDLKSAVLYFYPKADTPGCTNEAKDFTALAGDFKKAGITGIYGMSKDKPAKLAKFADKYGLSVTLLSDEESDATEQMGAWVEKSMYGKKYMGIERSTYLIGKDGKVAQIWNNVKVKGHAEEVLAAAQAP
jgi:thioredoxin-dependent peroxiredoxin